MSSIRKELNELAIKIGAPIVGANISEQIRAINTHLGGTSHGANISERIDELTKVFGTGNAPVSTKVVAQNMPGVILSNTEALTRVTNLMDISWEQGSIQVDTGQEYDNDEKVRTADYIDVSGLGVINVLAYEKNGNYLEYSVVCFDNNKTDIADIYWNGPSSMVDIPSNTKYVRIVLRKTDKSVIAPDEVESAILTEIL